MSGRRGGSLHCLAAILLAAAATMPKGKALEVLSLLKGRKEEVFRFSRVVIDAPFRLA